jgi:riboflavin kinase/FMN adenylyltransferase
MKLKTIYALGFFDGVHIGHGALLAECRRMADKLGCRAAAVTFSSHPDTLVLGKTPGLINTIEDRVHLLKASGMDDVVVLPFDKKMQTMPWQEFLAVLQEHYDAAGLVCGHDFRFGYKGSGTTALLEEYCAEHGLGCDILPAVTLHGTTVSSTYIRQLLLEKRYEEAEKFLGHGLLRKLP